MNIADLDQLVAFTGCLFVLYGEFNYEARWYGGSGVTIYLEGEEVDYFQNFNLRSEKDFLEAVKGYIIGVHELNELDNSNEDSQN